MRRRHLFCLLTAAALAVASCGSESIQSGGASTTPLAESTIADSNVPTSDVPTTQPPASEPAASAPVDTPTTVTDPPVPPTTATPAPTDDVFLGPPGTESQLSTVGFAETVANALAAIEADADLTLIAQIDHAADAAAAGIEVRPTTELIFLDTTLGTRLMQQNPTIGIDLPQQLLITQDASGNVGIFWNRPGYLVLRHQLDVAAVVGDVDAMSAVLRSLGAVAGVSTTPSTGGRPSPGAGQPPLVVTAAAGTARAAANRLVAAIRADPDLMLIADVDHGVNATNAGLALGSIIDVIFDDPSISAPMVQSSQTVAIDLPHRMLFVETVDGVQIIYNDPAGIAARHGVDPALAQISLAATTLAELASLAAG